MEPTETEDLFHLGIKALIRNDEGKILLLKVNTAHLHDTSRGAYWDLPGGRVQRGSSVEDTLRRELEEETGLTAIKTLTPFAMTLSPLRIPLKAHDVGLILSAYLCEIEGEAKIRLSSEHTDYAWFLPSDAASQLQVKYSGEFTDKIRTLQHASGKRTANIGCEAYVVRDGQLLLGLRKNVFGAGTWALPGGHLEFLDSAAATAARELAEETGIQTAPAAGRLLAVTDTPYREHQTHYIHLTFGFEIGDQEAHLKEPETCAEWRWFPLDALPTALFPPHAEILKTIQAKRLYRHS